MVGRSGDAYGCMFKRAAPYLVLIIAAPLLVLASLVIPARVHSPADARRTSYGYPVHFATSRVDSLGAVLVETMTPQEARTHFPVTVPLNPRDNPTSFDGRAFAESTCAVAALILLVFIVIRAWRRPVRRHRRPATGT